MSSLDDSVPWGRPAVDSIPLPPFATPQEHTRFTRMLQLYVALADEGAPSLSAQVLAQALAQQGQGPDLSPLELTVALATFFPAPWTPSSLAAALGARERFGPTATADGGWNWAFDPDFTAVPRPGGGWEVERHERGSHRPYASLERDGDLMLMWMDHYRTRFAYPYGWRVEEGAAAELAAPARAVGLAQAADTEKPYLAKWRAERARYLDEG